MYYARRYPGNTATQIAHALKAKAATVSSVLYRAVQAGELSRTDAEMKNAPWHRRGGGGPAGGHCYGPAGWAGAAL